MTPPDTTVACPQCRQPVTLSLAELGNGRSRLCPHCGTVLRFAGPDLQKLQQVLDQLGAQAGAGAVTVKVSVKVKTARPWWKFWAR